jgi:hypothetical protein
MEFLDWQEFLAQHRMMTSLIADVGEELRPLDLRLTKSQIAVSIGDKLLTVQLAQCAVTNFTVKNQQLTTEGNCETSDSRTIQKPGWVVLSCSTAIVIQHATEAALALDRSIAKG